MNQTTLNRCPFHLCTRILELFIYKQWWVFLTSCPKSWHIKLLFNPCFPGPGDNIALRAVVSEGSKVYLPRVFSTEDTYILTVTATNKRLTGIPSAVNSTTIYVLQGVNFTIIDAPDFAKTNTPVILTIEPHTGMKPTLGSEMRLVLSSKTRLYL